MCDCKDQFRVWNMSAVNIRKAGYVEVQKNCFAIMFTNLGDTVATLNNIPVFPSLTPATSSGESVSLSGHTLDLYKGKLQVKFEAGGTNDNNLLVTQLFYWDGEGISPVPASTRSSL